MKVTFILILLAAWTTFAEDRLLRGRTLCVPEVTCTFTVDNVVQNVYLGNQEVTNLVTGKAGWR
jgi:hypothetical protein